MKYEAYYTDVHGRKHHEGYFTVARETDIEMTLKRVLGTGGIFPKVDTITLLKEPIVSEKRLQGMEIDSGFAHNFQYWGETIQAHLGDFPFAFVFEPVEDTTQEKAERQETQATLPTFYYVKVEDTEKAQWLEDFLEDNGIEYSKNMHAGSAGSTGKE